MKNILITGVAGFIGSNVARRFLDEGYRVVGVDDLSSGFEKQIPKGVDFIEGDLSNKKIVNSLPKDSYKILHIAGQSSGEISFQNPYRDLEKNTLSTLNLIDYGIKYNAERFIYASSMSVYGNVPDYPVKENLNPVPLSCYGVGKFSSEQYLNIFNKKLPYISLRMFNVYGPGQDLQNLSQGMVSIYLSMALNDSKILIKGSLNRFRDFIYIDDVVEAWYKATLSNNALNQVFNIGTGVKTTVHQLVDQIVEIIPSTTYSSTTSTAGDQFGIYANVDKSKQLLGLKDFTSLKDGLNKFYMWAINA
tara:strand:- start:7146 stop:8060 length:915 start_codon:yes stop_codon:yes gene_type:complete